MGLRLSFSSISAYQKCPLCYRFQYVEKLPTKKTPALSFGSSLHAALARFYDVPLPVAPSLEELLATLDEVWESGGYANQAEEDSRRAQARHVLKNFYETNAPCYQVPIAIEQRFQIDLDGFSLSGIIDRMDKLPSGGYEIIDYKTGRRLPPKGIVESDLQLSIYHLAAKRVWEIEPERLSLYFIVPNQKMSTSRTEAQTEKTIETIKGVVEGISARKFEPKENPLCPYCDFASRCPLFRHKHERMAADACEKPVDATQIERIVAEYLAVDAKIKESRARHEELKELIHGYCETNGISRLFCDGGAVTRRKYAISSYDEGRLKDVLEPLGLWDGILTVDPKLLKQLLADKEVSEDVRRLIEEAKEIEDTAYALYAQNEPEAAR